MVCKLIDVPVWGIVLKGSQIYSWDRQHYSRSAFFNVFGGPLVCHCCECTNSPLTKRVDPGMEAFRIGKWYSMKSIIVAGCCQWFTKSTKRNRSILHSAACPCCSYVAQAVQWMFAVGLKGGTSQQQPVRSRQSLFRLRSGDACNLKQLWHTSA